MKPREQLQASPRSKGMRIQKITQSKLTQLGTNCVATCSLDCSAQASPASTERVAQKRHARIKAAWAQRRQPSRTPPLSGESSHSKNATWICARLGKRSLSNESQEIKQGSILQGSTIAVTTPAMRDPRRAKSTQQSTHLSISQKARDEGNNTQVCNAIRSSPMHFLLGHLDRT